MQAIAIINADGGVTWSGSTDRIPWWSFTETVLSIATLRLMEEGALELDEKLPGELFSARHLLRREAGLPDYGGMARCHSDVAAGKQPWPVDRLLAAVDVARLRYEPGAGWIYSNIGYLSVAQPYGPRARRRSRGGLSEGESVGRYMSAIHALPPAARKRTLPSEPRLVEIDGERTFLDPAPGNTSIKRAVSEQRGLHGLVHRNPERLRSCQTARGVRKSSSSLRAAWPGETCPHRSWMAGLRSTRDESIRGNRGTSRARPQPCPK